MYSVNQFRMALLPPLLLGTLIACSSEETVSTAGANFAPQNETGLHLRAVSSKPWLVTGGDVLVELELAEPAAGAPITLELNGIDFSDRLVSVSSRVSQALLDGLPEGDSLLLARAGEQQRQLRLTNYPSTGPIISGPHETPFFCQTAEFRKANGEMFGTGPESECEAPLQTGLCLLLHRTASLCALCADVWDAASH